MVYGGIWWYTTVCRKAQWCTGVYKDKWLCVAACGAVQRDLGALPLRGILDSDVRHIIVFGLSRVNELMNEHLTTSSLTETGLRFSCLQI